ncbi:MAG: NAD-dependent succinate-semialdehyde dehydrogenase [Rickettsiales bacterium]|nr:NAD-dependent succinate-semialdehyde dehydrogenase [Rickettsiales bacterium]
MDNTLSKLIINKDLLKTASFINGKWQGKLGRQNLEICNPADGHIIASIPEVNEIEISEAITGSLSAFNLWKNTSADTRASILKTWHNLINDNRDDIATIMTIEQGKPLKESLEEIKYGNAFVEWFAEEAKRIHGDIYPNNYGTNKYIGIKEPIGVTAAITPWNFPFAMITRKISPALAAGCTVILKPSEETPLTALALAELARQAGLPNGVLNVLVGNPEMIGEILCKNNTVRKLSFTGSTEIGKLLYKQCAPSLKKLSLELGGNAPFIVFQDADIQKAAESLVAAKSRNTGQSCTNVNRVIVHQDVFDVFSKLVIDDYSKLEIAPGLDNKNQGPLINTKSVQKIENLVTEAIAHGAKILYQSKKPSGQCFYPLTILESPTYDIKIAKEEIFGPVIVLYKFNDYDQMIQFANNTNYGLAAYFFSNNNEIIWNTMKNLEFAMIGINDFAIASETIPFGGTKHSGFGYEGSKYGIEEYLHIKYCCLKT